MIRVALIEDQPHTREGLALLIGGSSGYQMAGKFACMEEALSRIPSAAPDVALVDLGLPGLSGIEGIRRLKESCPGLLMLVLTVYDDDERIFDALCAGAC